MIRIEVRTDETDGRLWIEVPVSIAMLSDAEAGLVIDQAIEHGAFKLRKIRQERLMGTCEVHPANGQPCGQPGVWVQHRRVSDGRIRCAGHDSIEDQMRRSEGL